VSQQQGKYLQVIDDVFVSLLVGHDIPDAVASQEKKLVRSLG
jgi:hypothetical protein